MCLTLGVAALKQEAISRELLHYTVTEQCITTTQLNSAGPLPSGAARELWLDVGRGCWVLNGGGGGVRGCVQHPCLPLRLTVPSPDAEWEVFSSW